MRRARRQSLFLATLTAGALVPGAASAAIAPEPVSLAPLAASPGVQLGVAAAAGWTAWSDQQDGAWVLKLRAPDGTISTPAAVGPARSPFRVTLGQRSSGAVQAAWDVCPGSPAAPRAGSRPRIGPSCRVELLDVAGGTVSELPLARKTTSNALPALSGDTLAVVAPGTGRKKRTASVVTIGLDGGPTVTRWTGKLGHGEAPLALALHGRAVAALWSQAGGVEQRVEAQPRPGAKLRRLSVAGGDESCCESDAFVGLAFADATHVSVLDVYGDDEGDAAWKVLRLGVKKGAPGPAGPTDEASGSAATALQAVALAEDGGRSVVLAADATHPYGVYAFTAVT